MKSSTIFKILQLALIADQQYELLQAPGTNVGTLLQPDNFNTMLVELATVFAPKPTV